MLKVKTNNMMAIIAGLGLLALQSGNWAEKSTISLSTTSPAAQAPAPRPTIPAPATPPTTGQVAPSTAQTPAAPAAQNRKPQAPATAPAAQTPAAPAPAAQTSAAPAPDAQPAAAAPAAQTPAASAASQTEAATTNNPAECQSETCKLNRALAKIAELEAKLPKETKTCDEEKGMKQLQCLADAVAADASDDNKEKFLEFVIGSSSIEGEDECRGGDRASSVNSELKDVLKSRKKSEALRLVKSIARLFERDERAYIGCIALNLERENIVEKTKQELRLEALRIQREIQLADARGDDFAVSELKGEALELISRYHTIDLTTGRSVGILATKTNEFESIATRLLGQEGAERYLGQYTTNTTYRTRGPLGDLYRLIEGAQTGGLASLTSTGIADSIAASRRNIEYYLRAENYNAPQSAPTTGSRVLMNAGLLNPLDGTRFQQQQSLFGPQSTTGVGRGGRRDLGSVRF